MYNVIAIGNQAHRGKTTVGHVLHALFSEDFVVQQFNFADPLKSDWRIKTNIYDRKDAGSLQKWADETKSIFGEGVFARDLVARIKEHAKSIAPLQEFLLSSGDAAPPTMYIVSDLRHKSEYDELVKLRDEGSKVVFVKVERPDFNEDTGRDPNHRSEHELDGQEWADYVLQAKDLKELITATGQLFQELVNEEANA